MKYEFTTEHGPLDDYSLLLARLILAAERGRLHDFDRVNIEETRADIKQIGTEIYAKFGHEAMTTANNALFAFGDSRASAAVDHIWNGIGDWLT